MVFFQKRFLNFLIKIENVEFTFWLRDPVKNVQNQSF